MNIKKQIKQLEQQIRWREIADDGYYLSRQYKEDCQTMYQLKKQLNKKASSK